MRLSEIKGDKAFEVMTDLMTPIKELAFDDELLAASEDSYFDAVHVALRKHPKALKDILAILDLEDPETYELSLASIITKVMELVNDPDIQILFTSQSQMDMTPTGSATENIEDGAK